jgi:uncharacterized protein (TIGR02145 family)
MKKFFYFLVISILTTLPSLAQNEGISFQGLARNAAGEVIVSQKISLRLSILLNSVTGEVVYTETRQTITNPQGIFAVVVGDGTANSKTGNFSTIDWGTASKFIKVEMDPNAGLNFTTMGTSKLQPVPFAFYAYGVDAENVQGIVPVGSGGTGVASMAELKTSLGVDQVNNTSDANKPLSTAATTALATKVDKVSGKELSTNDYTTVEKTKLAAITGTNTGDQDLSAYATTTQLATKANASDVAASLATKVDKENGKGLSSNDYTTAEKIKLASITGDVAGPTGPAGPTGATGPTGPAGPQGPIGLTGPTGPAGATGPQGPIGLTGAAGATGSQGPIGIIGATGSQGPIGLTGPAGNDGAVGPQGATGAQGPIGLTGPAGATGPQGPIGAAGANGKTVINGSTNPAAGTGQDGDFYINTATNTLFGPKVSGAWPLGVSLIGPIGATGPAGAAGVNGVAGANGLDGKTVLNGTTDPGSSTGENGDFYINTTSNKIFGPKASGVWPAGVSLIGIASVGAISGTSTANGASITGGELKLAPADGTSGGIVTITAQTFAGAKTFSSDLTVNGVTVGKGQGNITNNTAFGSSALVANTTGYSNTAIGASSLLSNTTGFNNISVNGALTFNTSGNNNIGIGLGALQGNKIGSTNIAIGREAGFHLNSYNSGAGAGGGNIFIGYQSGISRNRGSNNTALGHQSLYSYTVDFYDYSNTAAFGMQSGFSNRTNNNTFLGALADVDYTINSSITNATALGYKAKVVASNTIQLGADGTAGSTAISNVKTTGTITAGSVTYPNTDGSANQVLSTNGSGTLAWTTPAAGLPTSGNTAGDMLFWNGSAWVKVAAGTDGQTLTFYNGAPVWITPNNPFNNTVVSTTGKIWMDRNLGATRVATSSTDANSYGDLYQWGRGADGHQLRTSGSTNTLASTDVPGNANFIIVTNSFFPFDWRSTRNNNLWQGVNGVNNPCPAGFRLPTKAEWEAEFATWSSQNTAGAFASPLKLTVAGFRWRQNGSILDLNDWGRYWSSTITGDFSYDLTINSSSATIVNEGRAEAVSVRCIMN